MHDEAFNPEDALEFVGVAIPISKEERAQADHDMAACFIEEYVRMGYSSAFILKLCRNPFYRGLHAIWKQRGEPFIVDLIRETLRQWRPDEQPQEETDAPSV